MFKIVQGRRNERILDQNKINKLIGCGTQLQSKKMGVHEYGWRTMVTNKYYEWVTC